MSYMVFVTRWLSIGYNQFIINELLCTNRSFNDLDCILGILYPVYVLRALNVVDFSLIPNVYRIPNVLANRVMNGK